MSDKMPLWFWCDDYDHDFWCALTDPWSLPCLWELH